MSVEYLAGRELPANPAVVSHEVVLGLLRSLDEGSPEEQCFAAHRLAALVETEEAKYRAVVGDPHANPSLRNHYAIGKILGFIKEEEDVYDRICETWLLSRNATPEQQVAGLRLLLAVLECWLFQYPLTEEALVERLGAWAVEGLDDKAPLAGDGAPGGRHELLLEARQTYALGVLGIALTNEEYADAAVRTPLVPLACCYLRRAVQRMSAAHAAAHAAAGAGPSGSADPTNAGGEPPGGGSSKEAPAAAAPESEEVAALRRQQLLAALRCLMCTGEYVESLGPFLQCCGVDTVCDLLRHVQRAATAPLGAAPAAVTSPGATAGGGAPAVQQQGWLLHEALQVVCSLLAHRKFAELLVEAGGVQLLLALPRNQHSYPGLSLALFGLAALPLAFERACALPPPVPRGMVGAALALLTSGSDVARKNAALFLDHALATRVVCNEFDAQEGLHRLLFPLRRLLALTREGGGLHPDVRTERQVAYHSARALLQYGRAHLMLQIEALRRRLALRHQPPSQQPAAPPPHKPLDTSGAAVADAIAALAADGRLAEAFARERWPLATALEAQGGITLLLELVHLAAPEDRYAREMSLHALELLQLLTLHPAPRAAALGTAVSPHRTGMAVLLHAAGTGHAGPPFYGLADPEVIATALHVIVNCVTAPPSLAYLLPPPDGTGSASPAAAARQRQAAAAAAGPPPTPTAAHPETPGGARAAAGARCEFSSGGGAKPPDGGGNGGVVAAANGGGAANAAANAAAPALSPRRPDASEPAPPSLELGPAAVGAGTAPPTLGDALEAGYAAARQAVRAANGIRVLLSLLQSRQHFAAAAADRTRALTVAALLGLARDAPIRHILSRLQVGKQLAELVREPAAAGPGGGPRGARGAQEGVDGQGGAQGSSGAPSWHERFNRDALELIALTTTSGGPGRSDRVTAAATDAAAPALLKIERAAVAAATHIAFPPQELLLLIYEHLKASGLHAAAGALAREAALERQATAVAGAGGGSSTAAAAAAAAAGAAASGGGGGPGAAAGSGGGGATPGSGARVSSGSGGAFADAAAGSGGGGAALGRGDASGGGKDKRRGITLAPSLLQHIAQQKQQIQQQQQQQHTPGASGDEGQDASGSSGRGGPQNQQQQQPSKNHSQQQQQQQQQQQHQSAQNHDHAPPPQQPNSVQNHAHAHHPQQQHGQPQLGKRKAPPAGGAAPPAGKRAHGHTLQLPAGPGDPPDTLAVTPTTQPSAAAAAAAGVTSGGGRPPAPAGAMSPPPPVAGAAAGAVPPAKRTPRAAAGWALPGGPLLPGQQQQQHALSDADYLSCLTRQHHQQHARGAPLSAPHPALALLAGGPSGPDPAIPLSPAGPGPRSAAGHRSPSIHAGPGGAGGAFAGAAAAADHSVALAAGANPAANPYLVGLPSRRGGLAGAGRRGSLGTELPQRLTPLAEAAPEPRQVPLHVAAAARDVMTGPLINSRLGAIVLSHLKQQHRAACLASPNPISTLPPVSLLRPYSLPVARRELDAPRNVTGRVARREVFGGCGGRGGATLDRRLIYSRFRPGHVLRDEGSLLTSAAFARGYESLVVGCSGGELRVHDAYSGEGVDEVLDAHSGPVVMLQTHESPGRAPDECLLASSSRHEAKLWRGPDLAAGYAHEFPGLTRARFNPAGTQIVGVSSQPPRRALIYDVATGGLLATLDDAAAAASRGGGGPPGGDRGRGAAAACFSPTGELLLWGPTLWDPRVPVAVHTFDQLSEHQAAGSAFHPGGLELILNSEVWDLRTFKLMRSVPCLDATSITFNSGGDVIFARLRRPSDDSLAALLHPRRRRHPLATAFRTVDACSYAEIATVDVERAVLDLALDPTDSYLAVVAVDVAADTAAVSSGVRTFEVGRPRPAADDESDDGDDAEDEEEEEADEADEADESAEEDASLEELFFGPTGGPGANGNGPAGAAADEADADALAAAAGLGDGAGSDGGSDDDGDDGGGSGDGGGGAAALAAVFRHLQEMGGDAEVEVELDLSDVDGEGFGDEDEDEDLDDGDLESDLDDLEDDLDEDEEDEDDDDEEEEEEGADGGGAGGR